MSSPQLPNKNNNNKNNDDDDDDDSAQPLYIRDEERGEEMEQPLLLLHPRAAGVAGFKILSFTAGSLIAVASQLILAIFMWNDGVLEQSVGGVLLFSLVWSFWTCAMIFGGLYLLIHCLQKSYADADDDESMMMQDSDVLQLEVYNVVGALSAVSLAWLVNDVLHVRNTFLADPLHQWMVVGGCLSGYALFCIWMVMQSCQSFSQARRRRERGKMDIGNDDDIEEQSTLLPAFRLIAGLLGLVSGACSQFFLAAVLWDATLQQPTIHSVIGFSFVWSMITVAITTFVCVSLKFLAHHSTVSDNEDETKSTTTHHTKQILQLRMEASFVSCTLVGICFAWIMMDVFMDMTEQVLPSLALLAVSLLVFRLILVCLPEEQCLQEQN